MVVEKIYHVVVVAAVVVKNPVTSYTLSIALKACSDITDLSTCSVAADNVLPADKPNLIESKLVDNNGKVISGAIIEATTEKYNVGTIEPVTRKTTTARVRPPSC